MDLTPQLKPERVSNKNSGKQEPSDQRNTEKRLGMFEFRTKVLWQNVVGFLILHLLGLYGLYLGLFVQRPIKQFLLSTAWLFCLLHIDRWGVIIAAHKLWSHRSYKANTPLQLILIFCQTMNGQNSCFTWARDHRQHHKYSETDADPHNINRGFFFAHIGWLMMKKLPEVIQKGKAMDLSDLQANPIVMFQKKYYAPLYISIAVLFPVLPPVYFWGEDVWMSLMMNYFLKYIIVLHFTWAINSWAHMYGNRAYDKNLGATNSNFLLFYTLGESWHNYHHAFPWDYRPSEYGRLANGTKTIIEFFARIGWAYDLREASYSLVMTKMQKHGDGSHPKYARKASEGTERALLEEYKTRRMGKDYETEEEAYAERLHISKTKENSKQRSG